MVCRFFYCCFGSFLIKIYPLLWSLSLPRFCRNKKINLGLFHILCSSSKYQRFHNISTWSSVGKHLCNGLLCLKYPQVRYVMFCTIAAEAKMYPHHWDGVFFFFCTSTFVPAPARASVSLTLSWFMLHLLKLWAPSKELARHICVFVCVRDHKEARANWQWSILW